MGIKNYILHEDGSITTTEDTLLWGRSFENTIRILANNYKDNIRVSTVFIGLDYSFGGGPPLIFETMIFGGPHDQYTDRYSTLKEALQGHVKACNLAGVDHGIDIQQNRIGI